MRKFFFLLFFLLFLPAEGMAGAQLLDVFVSIAPQQFVVDRIGGLHVQSHLLVKKGQDPHSFEPSPRQLTELGKARFYFTVGLPFERQLTERLGKSFEGLRFVAMDAGIDKLPMGQQQPGETHQGEKDPHIWLSPLLVIKMAENTAAALSEVDPSHAAEYGNRLEGLRKDLLEVNQRLSEELRPYKGRSFYVYHPAFGYFAAAYGLTQRAVEAGGRSPSPRRLATLIERAKSDKVRTIFVEKQFDTSGAESIAKAIDGVVVYLNPMAYDILGNFTSIADSLKHSFN